MGIRIVTLCALTVHVVYRDAVIVSRNTGVSFIDIKISIAFLADGKISGQIFRMTVSLSSGIPTPVILHRKHHRSILLKNAHCTSTALFLNAVIDGIFQCGCSHSARYDCPNRGCL